MAHLERINGPEDLKKLPVEQLPALADEIRQEIVRVIAKNGGHLGASLGTVELTIALHYVFNAPQDKIVWDTGHQAHGHKILTDRREVFESIRLKGGISGFPSRAESPYDTFGVGHASTSISAALGMAVARDLTGADHRVIAVIGDGALERRDGVRGDQQRGQSQDRSSRHPQRQQDVDREERGRPVAVSHGGDIGKGLQPARSGCVGASRAHPTGRREDAKARPQDQGEHQDAGRPRDALRGAGLSVLRTRRRPQRRVSDQDAQGPLESEGPDTAPRHHRKGEGVRPRGARTRRGVTE